MSYTTLQKSRSLNAIDNFLSIGMTKFLIVLYVIGIIIIIASIASDLMNSTSNILGTDINTYALNDIFSANSAYSLSNAGYLLIFSFIILICSIQFILILKKYKKSKEQQKPTTSDPFDNIVELDPESVFSRTQTLIAYILGLVMTPAVLMYLLIFGYLHAFPNRAFSEKVSVINAQCNSKLVRHRDGSQYKKATFKLDVINHHSNKTEGTIWLPYQLCSKVNPSSFIGKNVELTGKRNSFSMMYQNIKLSS